MPIKTIALISVISILVPTVSDQKKDVLKIGDAAPKFVLKDPHDVEYSLEKLLDKEKGYAKAVILLIGTHKVQEEGEKWAVELDKVYRKKKQVVIFLMGDLRDLPFFVADSVVKWGARREADSLPDSTTILLDWDGKVSKQYKVHKDKTNLIIIDGECKIAFQSTDEYSEKAMKKVEAKIDAILKGKQEASGGIEKAKEPQKSPESDKKVPEEK